MYCGAKSTGPILLADILPSLAIKLIAPTFIQKIHYNVKVSAAIAISIASFITVASSTNYSLILCGVALAALSSGIGEITFLALTSHFEKGVITAWSSGTGFAGILGATLYLALTLALTPSQTIYLMVIVPCLELITYWFILVHPATLNEPDGGFQPLLEEEVEEERVSETHIVEQPAEGSGSPCLGIKEALVKFVDGVKELKYYMASLMLVYASEYLINQGMFEIMWYKNSPWTMEVQYRVYQVLYQVGVTISRSSASCVHISKIHIFSILQFFNLILFACEARYAFIPSIWITLILIFYEGLLGGATYVNAFYSIYLETPHYRREYALGLASVSDSLGIVIAGVLATVIHNYICQFRVPVPV